MFVACLPTRQLSRNRTREEGEVNGVVYRPQLLSSPAFTVCFPGKTRAMAVWMEVSSINSATVDAETV